MIGKSVAMKGETWAYIKAHSKIGCSLKQISAEISVDYRSTNVSTDMFVFEKEIWFGVTFNQKCI